MSTSLMSAMAVPLGYEPCRKVSNFLSPQFSRADRMLSCSDFTAAERFAAGPAEYRSIRDAEILGCPWATKAKLRLAPAPRALSIVRVNSPSPGWL